MNIYRDEIRDILDSWRLDLPIAEYKGCGDNVDCSNQESESDQSEDGEDPEEYVCLDLSLLYGEVNGADHDE